MSDLDRFHPADIIRFTAEGPKEQPAEQPGHLTVRLHLTEICAAEKAISFALEARLWGTDRERRLVESLQRRLSDYITGLYNRCQEEVERREADGRL